MLGFSLPVQLPLPVRLQVLLRVLLLEERALAPLPPTLRLPMCVTSFWLQRSKPRPDPTILQAVLLGLTFGELSHRKTIPTGENLRCINVHALVVCNITTRCTINTV